MVLLELGLTYETQWVDIRAGEHKAPAYTQYNPNGRAPTLIDHYNNDFVIWYVDHGLARPSLLPLVLNENTLFAIRESCAILLYLVEKYDPERKLSVDSFEDKMKLNQWLFFQASGQGYDTLLFSDTFVMS